MDFYLVDGQTDSTVDLCGIQYKQTVKSTSVRYDQIYFVNVFYEGRFRTQIHISELRLLTQILFFYPYLLTFCNISMHAYTCYLRIDIPNTHIAHYGSETFTCESDFCNLCLSSGFDHSLLCNSSLTKCTIGHRSD